jgi:fatty-acyl-CoA synthase
MASTRLLPPAQNAYQYPLLIKQLLASGPRFSGTNDIIYADKSRYSYKELQDRIGRLANALTRAGVQAGDTVRLAPLKDSGPLPRYSSKAPQ